MVEGRNKFRKETDVTAAGINWNPGLTPDQAPIC